MNPKHILSVSSECKRLTNYELQGQQIHQPYVLGMEFCSEACRECFLCIESSLMLCNNYLNEGVLFSYARKGRRWNLYRSYRFVHTPFSTGVGKLPSLRGQPKLIQTFFAILLLKLHS